MARLTATHRAVAHWLATGETGSSSMTMGLWLCFTERYKHASHPRDPADFNRCLQLLEVAPKLRERMGAMRGLSREWTELVARWDEIEKLFLEEAGLGWTKARQAPRTYDLMSEVLGHWRPRINREALQALLRRADEKLGPEHGR